MENPALWGEAEKIVAAALERAHEARLKMICGFSTPKIIVDALREAGLLVEESTKRGRYADDEHY